MARAKDTSRAEARRKYREQVRAAEDGTLVQTPPADEQPPAPRPSMFRMPNVREDLRIRRACSGCVACCGSRSSCCSRPSWSRCSGSGGLPADLGWLVSLAVELLLRPTGLFVFFIGGFLAPRASYLVGAVLGIIDGILWALLGFLVPGSTVTADGKLVTTGPALTLADAIVFILVATVVGILAASFAAWYRNFLRSSQERARQNRIAREQQQAAKAKADARAQRQAARGR
ncbi:MAG: hypothetical protein R3C32_14565 [Chloroflexota bacterium]